MKPIVQEKVLESWGVDPQKYFGEYPVQVGILIDPVIDPEWINDSSIFKVAVQAEPPSVYGRCEKYLLDNGNKYDLILTYYESILNSIDKAKMNYFGGTWIRDPKENFIKTKKVSFITSNKNFTRGHAFRLRVVREARGIFDLYGRGFKEIEKKEEGLEDYMFSIAIENEFMKNWFTEKIIDCFMTKTIPIYKGCPNIGDYYNTNGIIFFNDVRDLRNIIASLNEEKYNSMISAVNDNYKRAISEKPFNERIETQIKKYLYEFNVSM